MGNVQKAVPDPTQGSYGAVQSNPERGRPMFRISIDTKRMSLVRRAIAYSIVAAMIGIGTSQWERTSAQGMNPSQVAAAIKANAQALKAFSWQQRTQIQLKGETKKVVVNQMSYDGLGNQQKVKISEQP